jgi:Histidine kinase-, DNA gyrase B-, and HSP90-like ATPase
VRVYSDERDAVLEVEDTGIGIAEEDLPRIFDRFWRGDMSRSRANGGSGIGLALVQELVHGHDGEIAVRSKLGAGTTFRVTLPAAARSLNPERRLRYPSLTHYSTPAGRPLVVASIDPKDCGRDVGSVVQALRHGIATGQRVLVVQTDDWPDVWSDAAIDALARIEGEARARGGTVVLLAESLDARTRLLLAGAHHTIPVVASVAETVETLADLGLMSPIDNAPAGRAA